MPTSDADSPAPASAPEHPARRHGAREEFEHAVGEARAQLDEARAQFDEANARINARTGRNLLAAIGIGVTLGALFLVSLLIVKWLFLLLAAALIGLTVVEFSGALRRVGRDVPRVASTVVAVGTVPVAFFLGVEGLWIAALVACAVVTLWRLVEQAVPARRSGGRDLLSDLGAGVLVQVYVTFLAGFYVVLVGREGGEWWTLASILVVVMTDIGAYASGLAFGRRKLAPTISPGKTWEGFAGSILVALVAGVLSAVFLLGQPWWIGAIMGVLLALVGTMGDLTESLIKRDLGIKDISSMLPGHGGFLDRLDSILPSAAVAYVLYLVVTGAS